MIRFAIALSLIPSLTLAQELAPRWTEMGRVEAVVDGTPATFVIPYDTEKERARAKERMIMGERSINLLASTVDEEGAPGSPQLQLTFFYKNGAANLLSMEIFDDGGFNEPLVADPDHGQREITEISEPAAGQFDGVFEAELIRLTGYAKGEPEIVDGQAPVSVSGRFTVTIPPAK